MHRPITRRALLLTGGTLMAAASGPRPSAEPADPPFHLGTVTYNVCKDWDLPTLLRILPAAGVSGIEFRTTHAHGVEPSLGTAARREVRRRCADAGIRQISLGTTCEFQSPDRATVRKNVAECAEWVKLGEDLGARGIKVRPNGLPKDVPVDQTLEQIGAALRECGRMAADHGVEIWLEVHGPGTQEPLHLRRILDVCGHRSVGSNWNSNPTDVKDGSIRAAFELLRPSLMSCHINDLSSGYPYAELFRLMRETGYDRFTNFEVGRAVKPEEGLAFYRIYRADWLALARG